MAAWGAIVCVGLLFVLLAGDPGPGGPVPLVLGGLVIGVAPVLFGGTVCWTAVGYLRALRSRAEEAERGAAPRVR